MSSTAGRAPLVVEFDGSGSFDTDGIVIAYAWEFGDGAQGSGARTEHTFLAAGTYQVILTVRDDDQAEASSTLEITVAPPNTMPTARFVAAPTPVEAGEPVHFDASSSTDPEGAIRNYAWTLGDGSTGQGVEIMHAYAEEGVYRVTLAVTDADGAVHSTSETVSVESPVLQARFSPSSSAVEPGEIVRFDATASSSSDEPIAAYRWAFGDGATGSGDRIDHQYDGSGTFAVTLTISTASGRTAVARGTVSVVEASVAEPAEDVFTRIYRWSYGGVSRQLAVSVPVDLYTWAVAQPRDIWPYRDYDEYVLHPSDDELMRSIAHSLTLDCYYQTVNNALAFVQTAIAYVPDPLAFEYPRYPAESLVDEAGDCEDSAILYASIVRTLGYGALLVSVDTDRDGRSDHMVVFVPVGETYDAPSLWEYEGRWYALAETAVEGGTMALGVDPWGLEPGDIGQAWDVARVHVSPRMIKRVSAAP